MGRPEFSGSVQVVQESTFVGTGSLFGELAVGIAPAEVRVGAEKLLNRTLVGISSNPTNTGKIYIGLDNTVTSAKYFAVLLPGGFINVPVDRVSAPSIYVISDVAAQKIGVLEGIN